MGAAHEAVRIWTREFICLLGNAAACLPSGASRCGAAEVLLTPGWTPAEATLVAPRPKQAFTGADLSRVSQPNLGSVQLLRNTTMR